MWDKIYFIDALCDDDNESIKKKIVIIQKLSFDKNPEVRMALARQLVLFDVDEIEEILYQMLFDRNRMVRLEAVDSLSIGRQEKTIDRIKYMLEKEGYLIRSYAVSTLFDLIINRYGVNSYAYSVYEKCVSEHYSKEKNTQVLLSYYLNQFFMNSETGFYLLEKIYREAVEQSDYKSIWILLHFFEEIQNFHNQNIVNNILKYKTEKLLLPQNELVKSITTRHVNKKILIVDQDNTYLSHVVSSMLNSMNNFNIEIKTAGVNIGTVDEKKIRDFCDRYRIKQKDRYSSQKIMNVYLYDFIICLNTMISRNLYSLCNVFYFEGLDVNNDYEIIETCNSINRLLG